MLQKGYEAYDAIAAQALGDAPGLKIMACPFDNFPKITWMTAANNPLDLNIANRDYSMVSAGTSPGLLFEYDPTPKGGGLPPATTSGFMGVGIYMQSGNQNAVTWNPPGYPETIVRRPSGTLMLVEVASSQGPEGNVWVSCSTGPIGSGDLYQIDTSASTSTAILKGGAYGEGKLLYPAQQNRFNYVFHDGHVELLSYQQTTNGATAPGTPGGMWSVNTAD